MANARYYSSIALPTTITGGIGPSNTSVTVASLAGYPGSLPYIVAIDFGAMNEELVLVTAVAGLNLTITRAYDGTSASSHNPGAVVRHVTSAIDFTDSRTHEASSAGVHGVVGNVVGTTDTQTLTNKTATLLRGSLRNIQMFNQGTVGITQIIGDSTNPSVNRFEILENELTLNPMIQVISNGGIKSTKLAADSDGSYKFRLTDPNGTTDRAAILAGGTVAVTPTASTTFPAFDATVPDLSTTKWAMRVAATGGTLERFAVFNDGRVEIRSQVAATVPLRVFSLGTTGTGNLTNWIGPTSAIVASINVNGGLSINKIGNDAGNALNIVTQGTQTGDVINVAVGPTPKLSLTAAGNLNILDGYVKPAVPEVAAGIGGTVSAAANWSISQQSAVRNGGVISWYVLVQRTGGNLTFGASGGLTDEAMFTLPTQWRLSANLVPAGTLAGHWVSSSTSGGLTLSVAGVATITDGLPNSIISTNDTLRVNFTYVQG